MVEKNIILKSIFNNPLKTLVFISGAFIIAVISVCPLYRAEITCAMKNAINQDKNSFFKDNEIETLKFIHEFDALNKKAEEKYLNSKKCK